MAEGKQWRQQWIVSRTGVRMGNQPQRIRLFYPRSKTWHTRIIFKIFSGQSAKCIVNSARNFKNLNRTATRLDAGLRLEKAYATRELTVALILSVRAAGGKLNLKSVKEVRVLLSESDVSHGPLVG